MRTFDFSTSLVRAPPRSVVDGLREVDVGRPNYESVVREHTAYVRALEDADVSVEILPSLEAHPDSVFVEDTALVFSGAAIVLRPGAPTRMGETTEIIPALERHFHRVLQLEAGFVDGGDVLTTPRGILIGQSARTNLQGAKALVSLAGEIGVSGSVVRTPPGVLHFKSDCSLLDEDTVLSTARLAATGVFEGFRVVVVPDGEEGAANAVRVNNRVLMSDNYPCTSELLADLGYQIVLLSTREIAKIDAGLSCMSLRWHA